MVSTSCLLWDTRSVSNVVSISHDLSQFVFICIDITHVVFICLDLTQVVFIFSWFMLGSIYISWFKSGNAAKVKQWWSTIPLISIKRIITFCINSLNIKRDQDIWHCKSRSCLVSLCVVCFCLISVYLFISIYFIYIGLNVKTGICFYRL